MRAVTTDLAQAIAYALRNDPGGACGMFIAFALVAAFWSVTP